MLLPELCAYITTQIPSLVLDTNLFYGMVPPTPDICVCLFETGSWLPSEPDMGTGNMRLVFPTVQVITRGAKDKYDAPRLALQGIVTIFTKVVNQNLPNPSGGSVSYKAIEARQDAQFLQRDENFRALFVTNFKVTRAYSAT